MLRFRPNLVVGGAGLAPFAEDAWRGLALGAVEFRVAGEHVNEVGSRCRWMIVVAGWCLT